MSVLAFGFTRGGGSYHDESIVYSHDIVNRESAGLKESRQSVFVEPSRVLDVCSSRHCKRPLISKHPTTLAVAIPSLYTLAPPAKPGVGLFVHISHGAVLGVGFAALARGFAVQSHRALVGLGLAWGVVTWVLLAALLMPVWLSVVGSPANPPFPNFAVPSLVWHVVYGLVLAGVYTATRDVL